MTTVIRSDGKDAACDMELLRLWMKWDRVGDDLHTKDEMQRDFTCGIIPGESKMSASQSCTTGETAAGHWAPMDRAVLEWCTECVRVALFTLQCLKSRGDTYAFYDGIRSLTGGVSDLAHANKR